MGAIRELPQRVIERIAAGEVVERPASVVKELVENAIDAGARRIVVEGEEGGRRRIAVIDDGCGIEPDELPLAVRRHTTSKIATDDDLWRIRTMGFRGEALAAIGAVARLTITSRPNRPEVVEGARIVVADGAIGPVEPAGCPGGTTIAVEELFANVPARRKFLRSAGVEAGHIADLVTTYAVGNPAVRFEYIADGRRRFAAAAADPLARIAEVVGEEAATRLARVEAESPDIRVHGWAGEEGRARGRDVHLFLNGRPVRDRLLQHAVTAGFGERLDRSRFPTAVLWIEVDPARVDVNVHPAKREVRFAESGAVHDFVMRAVQKAIQARDPLHACPEQRRRVTRDTTVGVAQAIARFEEGRLNARHDFNWCHSEPFDAAQGTLCEESPEILRGACPERSRRAQDDIQEEQETLAAQSGPRPLGQLGSTYLVCEDADSTLVLIDQHAAHERLGFEELKRQFTHERPAQQRLLIPEQVELDAKAFGYLTEQLETLERAGFELEPFGGTTLVVKAVPELLGAVDLANLFEEIAGELEELGSTRSVEALTDRIFAVVACHAQVRAGDKLTTTEMAHLIRDMERCGITHCPHGRPAVVRIEKREIEKWFKRRK